MVFTFLLFLAVIVTFIFTYFRQKTLRYKIITSVIMVAVAIILFYVIVIALWNSSTDPAESRLQDREATNQNSH